MTTRPTTDKGPGPDSVFIIGSLLNRPDYRFGFFSRLLVFLSACDLSIVI